MPAEQVKSMRTTFGTPRLSVAPVLNGSSADDVISNPKITIVDDEPINVKVVRKFLELAGYKRFVTTTDSRCALQLIRDEFPDVVLLDVMMPHVSGLQILEQLRQIPAFLDLPVIILTAANDAQTKVEALRLGATEFLGKPLDTVELEARLRNVLIMKAHQDRLKNHTWELELEVAARSAELAAAYQDVVECLARVGEYRDNETGNHVLRVGCYAEIIARHLHLNDEFVERIRQAAALHDLGKVGIPDSILLKPGKLDEEEFRQIKGHCVYGKDAMSIPTGQHEIDCKFESHTSMGKMITGMAHSPVLQMAAVIAYTHHEKWNGTGYPCGLSGEDIPLEGRITAAADVFDALTSERPYKRAFSLDEALGIIRKEAGSHFDPAVVEAFFAGIEEITQVHSEFSDVTGDAQRMEGDLQAQT